MALRDWLSPDPELSEFVLLQQSKTIAVYKNDSTRILEDLKKEAAVADGGYGRKQIQELVQNAADAMKSTKGTIEVLLTKDTLYVANGGDPFVKSGVEALLYTHLSNKSDDEIGRFGLGFKSICGISDSPQIFSRSISFGFSKNQTASTLEAELGQSYSTDQVPTLRLAWELEVEEEFQSDRKLRALAEKAVTVIRIPLRDQRAVEELSSEINAFAPSFCLFAKNVQQLIFRNESESTTKTFSTRKRGDLVSLTRENGQEEVWAVVSRKHRPSPAALESAGSTAKRESVTVSWATPLSGAPSVGQLTAFFPVNAQITLSGYLNAPWKLSEDRMNVIESEFNKEILTEVVPLLVEDAKSHLIFNARDNSTNYGRYLDILPARGREGRSWADEIINEPIFRHLRSKRSLPNAAGEWRSPHQVTIMPRIVVDYASEWMDTAASMESWVHPGCCTSPERRAKAYRLQNRSSDQEENKSNLVTKWLTDVVRGDEGNPARSRSAIQLVEKISQNPAGKAAHAGEALYSQVVLLEDGTLTSPMPGNCFFRANSSKIGGAYVHPDVAADPGTRKSLEVLGITDFADNGELYEFIRQIRETTEVDWERGWKLFRGASIDEFELAVTEILGPRHREVIKVRNLLGEWVVPGQLFMPGELFEPIKEDGSYLADHIFHASDSKRLEFLGIYETPKIEASPKPVPWLREYEDEMFNRFQTKFKIPPVRRAKLELGRNNVRFGSIEQLINLSKKNNAHLTHYLLNRANPTVEVWYMGENKKTPALSPEFWLIKNHGFVDSSLGIVPLKDAFFLAEDSGGVSNIVPVATYTDIDASALKELGCRRSIEELSLEEFKKLPLLHKERDNERAVAETYAWWVYYHQDALPQEILVKINGEWRAAAPAKVAVTSDPGRKTEGESLGVPTLLVDSPDDCYNLNTHWGLLEPHSIPKDILFKSSSEPVEVGLIFPILEDEIDEGFDDLVFQRCESLSVRSSLEGIAAVEKDVSFTRDGNFLYSIATTDFDTITHILTLLELDSSRENAEILLEANDSMKNNVLRSTLRAMDNDLERLLTLVGEERLRSLFPQPAIDYLERYSNDIPEGKDLAKVCLDMYGKSTLEKACQLSGAASLSLPTPKKWAGSHQTRKWVRELGFDDSWAGAPGLPRATPTEYINGPIPLEELHDYQKKVTARLKSMLGPTGKNRGLLNLPTGAGKTRVAIESIIDFLAESKELLSPERLGPILWLADSEELCEQAIEAWSYLWRAKGKQDTQLIISRHFSNSYQAEEETAGLQVVVATYQKMRYTVKDDSPEFAWLSETPLVVIDEAHGAISSSYTKILKWTGRTSSEQEKRLLGLTATPFRGSGDSEETKRLHMRFHENFLADGVFGEEKPLKWLQDQKVLANVEMRVIQSERPVIHLTEEEKKEFQEKHWLPKAREQELGRQADRTRQIIESVKELPEDWPILIFAASVDNALTLATLLTLEGIPSTSIDSNTKDSDRRLALTRFRAGELRVITNYSVLSQGFDAPKTRAVYITRPVHSQVRYQQMIGRGLRGRKNGGTDEVLIVNLLDNLESFESSISYEDFSYLDRNSES